MARVQSEGLLARLADWLMMPIMYFLQGTLWETPQRTHFWNNKKLGLEDLEDIYLSKCVNCSGVSDARRRMWGWVLLFHLPIFGGWRSYVVLEPIEPVSTWYVGWMCNDNSVGMSRIRLQGSVRMLLGPDPVLFFGVTTEGTQVPIQLVVRGQIGDPGPYSKTPLL